MSKVKRFTFYTACTSILFGLIDYKDCAELPQFIYNQIHTFTGWEDLSLKEFVDKLAGDFEDNEESSNFQETTPSEPEEPTEASIDSFKDYEPPSIESVTQEPPPEIYVPVINCQTGEIIYFIKLE